MKASIHSAGGVASRVTLGAHDLVFDQPGVVPGGSDRGPSPLDVMVASVAACAHYYAAAFLFARKIPTEGLVVEVEAEKSTEPVARLGKLSMRVHLTPNVPARYIPALERAIRLCPAYGTLTHPPDVEIVISAPEVAPKASVA
jgi:uncharacterized OsmC-like protein